MKTFQIRRPRFNLFLGVLSALFAAFSPVRSRADIDGADPDAVPWTGQMGVTETVASIMAREKSNGLQRVAQSPRVKPFLRPDRHGLPQDPKSPDRTSFGAALKNGGSGPFTPQTVGTSLTAATLADCNAYPPDTMGAVGPTQFIVAVNGRIRTFNKATGVADGALNASMDTFFTSVRTASTSDPHIRYDRLSGRWFVVIIDVATPNRVLLAVSSGPTITSTSSFTFFFFQHDTVGTMPNSDTGAFADYPTPGIDANAIYIGDNVFNAAGTAFLGCSGFVVRKSSVLGAGPIVVTAFRGLVPSSSSDGPFTPQGVDNFDPAATEGYFIGVSNTTAGRLIVRRVSNPGGTPTISGNLNITVPTMASPLDVPHLGQTIANLDALDMRLFAAHLRNGRLWTAHNIGVDSTGSASGTATRTGSRWYELRNLDTTPALVQAGTVFDSAASNPKHFWIPSIMVSGQGHVAMGFSTAGAASHANAGTVGRLAGDAAGTMQTPVDYTASTTAYNAPYNRWGDYSYTSVDPNDDMTMWTIQEFCDATNSYGVRAVKLIAPPPAMPVSCAPASITTGLASVNVTVTGTQVSGSGFFDPGAGFASRLAGTVSGGVTVNSVTYNSPASVTLNLDTTVATPGAKDVTITNPDGQTLAGTGILTLTPLRQLTVSLPASATEGDAPAAGTVTASIAPASDLTVTLSSDTTSRATVPATVMILAGQTTANFTLTIVDDAVLNGTSAVTITATGATYADGTAVISIFDNETATLSVSLPASTSEGVGTVQGTVTVSAAPVAAVAVSLSSSDTGAAVAPATVTIPAGQTSANFTLTIIDDNKINGTHPATITAHVANWTDGAATISIADNENTNLVLAAPAQVIEGSTGTGTVSISGTLPSALVVSLASDNTSRLTLPATVTIAAGSTSATFTATAPDNTLLDGTQSVTITASASGFTGASGATNVLDNDAHHYAFSVITSPETKGAPFSVTITAQDAANATVTTYSGTPSLTATGAGGAVSISPATASGFVNGVWTGNVTVNTVDSNVVITATDTGWHTGASNAFNVVAAPDYFTELFTATKPDNVSNQSFLFTPDGSTAFYSVLRTPVSVFPADPSGGTSLTMSDDTYAQVTATGGQQVKLYGVSYPTFYVGSNGYITFTSGDTEWIESFVSHFNRPRISALFDDLIPTTGQVTWIQLADRVAVTWQGVPEYSTTDSNNFQIEMFFDGRIRITCLAIAATDGLIGLSQGLGTPSGFVESDFLAYPVLNNVIHHFAVSTIASPQIKGAAFSITITAQDVNNVTVASYGGAPGLSASGSVGPVSLAPTATTAFSSGVWTGNVTANTSATNTVLTVNDGAGHTGASNTFTVGSGPLHHFAWTAVASPQTTSAAFGTSVTAQDVGNNTVTGFSGTVNLSGFTGSGTASTIAITEINPNTPDEIEFMNVSSASVDISGWQVYIYDEDAAWPNPKTAFTIPAGTTCAAGQIFRLQEFGTAPGTFPQFYYGSNINWTSASTSHIAVLLRNASGSPVDFVCAGAATSSGITSPQTIPATQWTGAQISAPTNTAFGYSRIGTSDGNTAADWTTATPSMGTANPGLTTPFPPGLVSVPVTPAVSGSFVNGVWTGNITVLQIASQMKLRADDGAGHAGDSNAFNTIGNANLSTLVLSVGTLSPSFVSGTTGYTASVSNGTGTITVTPTALDGNATVKVNTVTVASGSASGAISLAVGANTIDTTVTAQDGLTAKTYSIAITRRTPYQDWVTGLGLGAPAMDPAGDFDSDGLKNILEWAFATNPAAGTLGVIQVNGVVLGVHGNPVVLDVPDGSGGVNHFALFGRRKDAVAVGLNYAVEFSANLSNWTTSSDAPTVIAQDSEIEAVTVPFPALVNGLPPRFFRIRITAQ